MQFSNFGTSFGALGNPEIGPNLVGRIPSWCLVSMQKIRTIGLAGAEITISWQKKKNYVNSGSNSSRWELKSSFALLLVVLLLIKAYVYIQSYGWVKPQSHETKIAAIIAYIRKLQQ